MTTTNSSGLIVHRASHWRHWLAGALLTVGRDLALKLHELSRRAGPAAPVPSAPDGARSEHLAFGPDLQDRGNL